MYQTNVHINIKHCKVCLWLTKLSRKSKLFYLQTCQGSVLLVFITCGYNEIVAMSVFNTKLCLDLLNKICSLKKSFSFNTMSMVLVNSCM